MSEKVVVGDSMIEFSAGRIRRWRRDDRASLLRHADDADVARFLSSRFPHPYRESDADAWFDFLESQAIPEGWAIEVGGQAVGGIGLRFGRDEFAHSAELGYWLGKAYWRRGIVSAAVRAFVPEALLRFKLSRITAYAATDNPGSIRVLESAGFRREGLMPCRAIRDGLAQDHIVFGLLAPQR